MKRHIDKVDEEIKYCEKHGRLQQKKQLMLKKEEMKRKGRKFVIIDDLAYKKGLTSCEQLRSLFMNGRHYFIFTIFSVQYCIDLNISLRGNVGYVARLEKLLHARL